MTSPPAMQPVICALSLLLLSLWAGCAPAAERSVTLAAPLTTIVPLDEPLAPGATVIASSFTVPADAPADLGIGAWMASHEGTWFQRLQPERLRPGAQQVEIPLTGAWYGEPHRGQWTSWQQVVATRAGIFFWSETASRAEITEITLELRSATTEQAPSTAYQLTELTTSHSDCRLATGERFELQCLPVPMSKHPFMPEDFQLSLEVIDPNGTTITVPGFYTMPMAMRDRGHDELAIPAGPARFAVRFRPRFPGSHQLTLVASWPEHEQRIELQDLAVHGETWDDYVRVDADDPRFFSTNAATESKFYWPTGLNIRSVNDPRGAKTIGSRITPARGWHAYEAYLERLAAAGGGAVEIWMSSWNLALEWRGDWHGFFGLHGYNLGNAERLDRILDHAWSLGIRVNLVIHNHGMASSKTDREWHNNPWNSDLEAADPAHPVYAAGIVREAQEFFTNSTVLAGQERLRRYLVARYADQAAVPGWKLWTEINLTQGQRNDVRRWHQEAAARWHALDSYYAHPVTTHWSGDYRTPDRAIVAQAGLNYICIDAYHGRREGHAGTHIADLVWDGLHQPRNGLGSFTKPIIITEFGGNWNACPEPQMIAEARSAPWIALMAGYGAGPMLWWFEWLDQQGHWQPFTAITGFLANEDLRNQPEDEARAVILTPSGDSGELQCRAWSRRGRLLGYLLDRQWGYDGLRDPEHRGARLLVGRQIRPGQMGVEWWDAETGAMLERELFTHPGGKLEITVPDFKRHIAFKLYRAE